MNLSNFSSAPFSVPNANKIKSTDSSATDQASLAADAVRKRCGNTKPLTCLILGSGMGALADRVEFANSIPYREIPGFPLSHVAGHAGKLLLGQISGSPVCVLAGRAHLYEGWTPEAATLPLRCAHALGATRLIVSNASGGINPRLRSGQIVLIDAHLNFLPLPHPVDLPPAPLATPPLRGSSPYDLAWSEIAKKEAIALGFELASGTYLATLGPSYETRSEYRMFARMGADMVGMSTIPEVLVAQQLKMKSLAFSIVTNVATPDRPTQTAHEEVLDWSAKAQSQLIPLIERLLRHRDPYQ